MVGTVIVNEGKVVRPLQLITSVGRTVRVEHERSRIRLQRHS